MSMTPLTSSTRTVLIIEDDAHLNRLFNKSLRANQFAVVSAHTLAEARDYVRSNPMPDLIILDLDLPDGHGTEILQCIAEGRLSETRVVVVSGALGEADNRLGLYQVDYALLKPVPPRALSALIESLF